MPIFAGEAVSQDTFKAFNNYFKQIVKHLNISAWLKKKNLQIISLLKSTCTLNILLLKYK